MAIQFERDFKALTGNAPFPWQEALFDRFVRNALPTTCDIPTGLGKTSVIAIWLLARALNGQLPRRLVYVVNRRTVVDQTTVEVEKLCDRVSVVGIDAPSVSMLRGQFADNRAWSEDPSRPAVVAGTVDMIGSRLLFRGYRAGFKTQPMYAGFLGQDALLVHDEAHLEPAFQKLVEAIQAEQRRGGQTADARRLVVMALTATVRNAGRTKNADAFGITDRDRNAPPVRRRLHAAKRLRLHEHSDKELVTRAVEEVLAYRDSGRAVLVFLRTVDDVDDAVRRLERELPERVAVLTGTMRGRERDQLAMTDRVFARFLPAQERVPRRDGTVVLVSTSAGEVGVNLSADHLVCDLSTFDAMAQRFGRVNRFGDRDDTDVHVFHPAAEKLSADPDNRLDVARAHTLELLRKLEGDASPEALSLLDPDERLRAFSPPPKCFDVTPALLDAWAMTSIRGAAPGRPPVAPYLHGEQDWEPSATKVAWRNEVDWIDDDVREQYAPRDVLEDYPLKPHELLSDRTKRVVETLARAHEHASENTRLWIVSDDDVQVSSLGELFKRDRNDVERRLADRTIVLSAKACRPVNGRLREEGWRDLGARSPGDVADEWGLTPRHADDGTIVLVGERLRIRLRDDDDRAEASGLRLVQSALLGKDDETADAAPVRVSWYVKPHRADDDGSLTAFEPVLLDVHNEQVGAQAQQYVDALDLEPGVARAVVLAAAAHDLGKVRRVWQRGIGNFDRSRVLAKADRGAKPRRLSDYRHELGSMLDAERDGRLAALSPQDRELALHLIAAHHGRARPHFFEGEMFDPERPDVDMAAESVRVMRRFDALQRRFGRWGLAYLESLVRAADFKASADGGRPHDGGES